MYDVILLMIQITALAFVMHLHSIRLAWTFAFHFRALHCASNAIAFVLAMRGCVHVGS